MEAKFAPGQEIISLLDGKHGIIVELRRKGVWLVAWDHHGTSFMAEDEMRLV